MNADDELIADLRSRDADRLYIALFTPEPLRSRLVSLFAFNLEVASTREKVSEAMLGHIRLQWWRDALTEIREGRPRAHPVVEALSTWMRDVPAAFDLAEALLDAREADLEDAPFETMAQVMDYSDRTSGHLLRLALLADGIDNPDSHVSAEQIGRAYALSGLIRAVPFLGAQGRVMLPGRLMAQHGIMDARQSIGRDPEKLRRVLAELADAAEQSLQAPKKSRARLNRAVTLHRSLAEFYLGRIRKVGFDLSDPRLDPGNAARIGRLYLGRLFGA